MTNDEPTRERKERVLHTRISEQLSDDIRAIADDLRVPVSNLVRNVLEEAFDAVERVSGDVSHLVEDAIEEAELVGQRYRRYRDRVRERSRARAQEARAAAASDVKPPPPAPPATSDDALGRVVAWQPVVLAAARRCSRSGRELRPGERAYLGLGESGPLGVYVAESAIDVSA